MDRRFKERLEARFGEQLTGPIRQRHDETEMRIGPGDVVPVMTALHDEPELRFEFLSDLAGVDTGVVMQGAHHLGHVLRADPDLGRVTFLDEGRAEAIAEGGRKPALELGVRGYVS